MNHYPFSTIESYWQQRWRDENTYQATEDASKPKYYVLDMFPYPSGTGLHIGHPEGYTATDIVSRYKRMCGYNVLHPMGFDAFGLPTERQAMVENIHPKIITERNIATFTRQLEMFGFDFDWSRTVNTTDPIYMKWTQWMFLQIYNSWYDQVVDRARPISELPIPNSIVDPLEIESYVDSHRLAYIAHIPVNWCEALGTVLANEEVDEWIGKGYSVERRPMRQWMLRITAYAHRLLDDLKLLDWPASTIEMQRNWIGRSEGAEIRFLIDGNDASIAVFTTRPDTIFGVTYLMIAPEHELVDRITKDELRESVNIYKTSATSKSELERTDLAKTRSGVPTGSFAINPITHERIPIWISDCILAHYGTGAVMGVPGHDQRDCEFAQTFGLPTVRVVQSMDESINDSSGMAFTGEGIAINSKNATIALDGLASCDAKRKVIEWLESSGIGRGCTKFKLRDWLFSRQRYWGEPIPIMYFEDGTKRSLDIDELPLVLPDISDFNPKGIEESALSTLPEWMNFIDSKTGKVAQYETNTMPQWAASCWYFLRYCDPENSDRFCSQEREKHWMGDHGVDLYIGGSEHAVLHLLYARFWHKVLYDLGHVSSVEPVKRLFHQGLILGEDGRKMSKSLGNSVNPDSIIEKYGADALRMYEMFLGPLESSKPWNTKGIDGISRFLDRVWRLIVTEHGNIHPAIQDVECTISQERILQATIKKTSRDIEALSFNTAIAQLMIFVNEFTSSPIRPRKALTEFLQCLAPFAPHITEELWHRLGHSGSIHLSQFPSFDDEKLIEPETEIIVQVNSKIRAKVMAPHDADESMLESIAKNDPAILKYINGKEPRRIIVVKGKLVNFIIP